MRALLALLALSMPLGGALAQDCAPRFELIAWPGEGEPPLGPTTLEDFAGGKVLLTNADVAEAGWAMDMSDRPVVSVRFTADGQDIFARHTTAHVGEPVAVVYDGALLTAPVVMAPITGGEAMISGLFTKEDAARMAERLMTKPCPDAAGS